MAEEAETTRPLEAVILAAGKGTRMQSDLAKVLHPVAGKPMVQWVAKSCLNVGVTRIVVVVGHQADAVKEALAEFPECEFVLQGEQLGTGHAVKMAEPLYMDVTEEADKDVFVLCGDGPLIREATLKQLLKTHHDAGAAATLATATLENPKGYGRIIRNARGGFEMIVEHKDADSDQLSIQEVNPSYYLCKASYLFNTLNSINNNNAKGEYYITDVFGLLMARGEQVSVVNAVPAEDVLSINTPDQLAEVDRVLRERLGLWATLPEEEQS